jgi:hypothetical protein
MDALGEGLVRIVRHDELRSLRLAGPFGSNQSPAERGCKGRGIGRSIGGFSFSSEWQLLCEHGEFDLRGKRA